MTTSDADLYHLLSWLSPSYPVGAFCHSGGLEWAVEAGWVTNREMLEFWLSDVVAEGAGWNDAVLFTYTHRAAQRGDRLGIHAVAELGASPSSFERRQETLAQGDAFWRIAQSSAPCEALALLEDLEGMRAYPVVVATLVAGHDIELAAGLTAYLHGMIANLVSAAQRLVPLGQTDGQRAMASLRPIIAATVNRATLLAEDDPFECFGSATLTADIATMLHETQYTRLFRT